MQRSSPVVVEASLQRHRDDAVVDGREWCARGRVERVVVDPTTRPADARRATAVIWRAGVDRRRAARERRGPGGAARVGGRC